MSDEQLRRELQELGFSPGPITDSTRGILEKKLQKLRAGSAKTTKTTRKSEKSRRSEAAPKRRQQVLEDSGGEDEAGQPWPSRPSPTPTSTVYGGSRRVEGAEESRRAPARFNAEDTEEWRGDRPSLIGETFSRVSAVRGEQHRAPLGGDRFSGSSDEHKLQGEKYRSPAGGGRSSGGTHDTTGYLTERHSSSLGGERFSGGTSEQSPYLGDRYRSTLDGERFSGVTSELNANFGDRLGTSLGRERFSGGTNEQSDYLGETYRSILARERITGGTSGLGYLGQENRPSLGGDRFSGGSSGYSSLGEKYNSELGRKGIPEGTAAYAGSFRDKSRSVLGGERVSEGTPNYGYPELRSRIASERGGWVGLAANRDGDRSLYGYNELGKSRGQLSHKSYPGPSHSKSAERSAWSRSLEYYLSRLLRGLSVLLVVAFLGILVVKSGIISSTQQNDIKLLPSECDGKDNQYCKARQKQITLQILSELYEFLSLEAGSFECGNPSGLRSKCVPVSKAKEHVTSVGGHSSKKFNDSLEWLLNRDEHLGIWMKSEDDQIVNSRSHLFCLESSQPRLGIFCRLKNALYTAISNLFLALFGVLVLWLFLIYLKFHWKKLEDDEKQMFEMVEKIIDVVRLHYKDYSFGVEQNPYIGILHVRDTLIMPQDRKRLKGVWERAVQFIGSNESRLRTESQRVAGADLQVWRWTQTRNDSLGERLSSTSLFSPLSKQ